MKKEIKKKQMQEVEIIESIEYFCDKCEKQITTDCYSRDRFKIEFRKGDVYPTGGTVDGYRAYLCESCANEIKSVLEENGVKFEAFEIDY
jgi:uncharacterized protein YlaI